MPVTVGLVLAVVVSLRCLLGSAQKAPFFLWLRFGSWDFHHLVVGQTISSGRNYEWYVICCVEIHFGSSQQRNNTVAYHSSDTWRSIYRRQAVPLHTINQSINKSIIQSLEAYILYGIQSYYRHQPTTTNQTRIRNHRQWPIRMQRRLEMAE